MEITEVKVSPVRKQDERLKAFVTIVLEDCFVIRDLKIINGNSGLFVAMPSRKKSDGTYADIAHPLNSEMRQKMEEVVLKEFERQGGEVKEWSRVDTQSDETNGVQHAQTESIQS